MQMKHSSLAHALSAYLFRSHLFLVLFGLLLGRGIGLLLLRVLLAFSVPFIDLFGIFALIGQDGIVDLNEAGVSSTQSSRDETRTLFSMLASR